jgi:hypothetical protein
MNEKQGLTADDYQTALDVQDACNLGGVIRAFSRILERMFISTGGTAERNTHPISVMFSSKIASLTGSETDPSFSEAYDTCKERSRS